MSTWRSPTLALIGVAGILVAIVAVAVLSRYQGGPATPKSATPPTVGSSPAQTSTSTVPSAVWVAPTIGPAFHETLPVVYTGQNLSVPGWSPDGSRFAVIDAAQSGSGPMPPTWTVHMFDRNGAAVATVDAAKFAWVDSNHYVILRFAQSEGSPGSGAYRAYFGLVGSISLNSLGVCDWLVAGPSGAVALMLPWDGTITSPPQYVVVDSNGAMSGPRSGYPISWSRDGSALAVIHPNLATPSGFGGSAMGWVEVVGPSGQSIAAARDVEAGTMMPAAAFSPDGMRVAFRDDTAAATKGEQIGVLDIGSGRLNEISGFGPFTWGTNDKLLFADLSVYSWSATSRELSVYGTGTIVGASGSGLVVIGTETSSDLSVSTLIDSTSGTQPPLTLGAWPVGGIPDAAWSPGGRSLVVISGESGLTYENAVLAQF
ncbi:MAG: hypothetical protein ACHQ01_07015 [Candidatus Limnocylindrales bacterium]